MRKHKGGFDTFTIDDYMVTEYGEVINKKWNRRVKPQPNGKGYLRVGIGGKLYFVHRLVAEKYVPNPHKFPQVNHKDGNKTNNRADNLEWVSNFQNRRHAVENGLNTHGEKHPCAKLSQKSVDYIRAHPELTRNELSAMFCISPHTISDIRNGRTWKSN